ncbi:aristolochene synthase [Fusarium sporotrichioides]|uniref:Aristolochene synthase n=1 Tax=Fusarium sporotrichioides TaxID=5514 RepID=A0A395S207_FUSSP|nr:aristolochene synthase [Fusarium sporotrichioides]
MNSFMIAAIRFVYNDLYSYDKEIYESKNFQGSAVKTVYVVEKPLRINTTLAKNITRTIGFDWEKETFAICEKLIRDPATAEGQRVHLELLFDSMAGNIFHSATISRYVRHAERPVPART